MHMTEGIPAAVNIGPRLATLRTPSPGPNSEIEFVLLEKRGESYEGNPENQYNKIIVCETHSAYPNL